MILNFKPVNVLPVQAGTKIHSMREDKHNRWKVGMDIQFSTGARTKWYKKFRTDGKCLGLQKVDIYQGSRHAMVRVDGRILTDKEKLTLAKNDGFKNVFAMMRFFVPEVPLIPSELNKWHGRIIHWTDKLY